MANGKVESIPTNAVLFAPEAEVEWFQMINPDKKFGKYRTDLIFTKADEAVINKQITDAIEPLRVQYAKDNGLSNIRVKSSYLKQHTTWVKETNERVTDNKGPTLHVRMDAFWKKSGDQKKHPDVFGTDKGDDGRFVEITDEVSNESRAIMKYTVNACFEKDQFGDTICYASIKPLAFQITKFIPFKRNTSTPSVMNDDPQAGF